MDPHTSHIARIREQGCTVLERAIAPDTVETIRDALLRIERDEGLGYAKTRFEGLNTVRINNLPAHDEVFWQVPLQPDVLAIAQALLDRELLLSSLCSLTLGPGQTAQPMHEDTQQIPLPRPHPPLSINAVWALSDFTEACRANWWRASRADCRSCAATRCTVASGATSTTTIRSSCSGASASGRWSGKPATARHDRAATLQPNDRRIRALRSICRIAKLHAIRGSWRPGLSIFRRPLIIAQDALRNCHWRGGPTPPLGEPLLK